jgi:hypothetical protein
MRTALIGLILSSVAAAQDDIEVWIEKLADHDIAERDRAEEELLSIPRDLLRALRQLEEAASTGAPTGRMMRVRARLLSVALRFIAQSANALDFAGRAPILSPGSGEIGQCVVRLQAPGPAARAAEARLAAIARHFSRLQAALKAGSASPDAEVRVRTERIASATRSMMWEFEPVDYAAQARELRARADHAENYRAMLKEAEETLDLLEKSRASRERYYQRLLAYYAAMRRCCAGDPWFLNRLDDLKVRAERAHGGAEKLVARARVALGGVAEACADGDIRRAESHLIAIKELRSRREFFQDERVVEMDKIIREAEKRLAEARKK